MKRLLISILFLSVVFSVSACSSGEKASTDNTTAVSTCSCNSLQSTVDLVSVEKVTAHTTEILQVPWGHVDENTIRLQRGPLGFCIDSENSIYINDYTNNSILKYGSDGSLIASIPVSKFTDNNKKSNPLLITCAANELILYEYGGSVIQKYNLEIDELSSLDLKEEEGSSNPSIENILEGENGIVYAFTVVQESATAKTVLYTTDLSLSKILEKRELPSQVNGIEAVDNLGNLYFGQMSSDNSVYKVQQVNKKNEIKDVLLLKKSDDNDNLQLLQVIEDSGFTLVLKNMGKVGILSIGGNKSTIFELPQGPGHIDCLKDGRTFFDTPLVLQGKLQPIYYVYRLDTVE